jgi:hypothetical protein
MDVEYQLLDWSQQKAWTFTLMERLEPRSRLPEYLIWKQVGLLRDALGSLSHIFCISALDMVPTPSLNTRPLNSTSFTSRTILGSIFTVIGVSEKVCPILAAHFAGDWMLENSPSLEDPGC